MAGADTTVFLGQKYFISPRAPFSCEDSDYLWDFDQRLFYQIIYFFDHIFKTTVRVPGCHYLKFKKKS